MIDLSDWPALVLTAGLATRLRPLSTVRAKAAIPVAGTTIIGRLLTWLGAAGVRRVVINLHHRPETITSVVGDGSEWNLQVRYSWERTLLGSAGGPRRALPLLEADRFLIINGDTLTDCDLVGLTRRHLASRAQVTMALVRGDVARYGGVLVRPDGTVTGFARGASLAPQDLGATFHFIGVQAVCASAFAGLPDDQPSETVRTVYPALIRQDSGSVCAFTSDAEFLDVGSPRDYLTTVALVAAREQRPFDCGESVQIGRGARIEQSVVWDRVTIGRDALLRRCVVADDVHVPAGAIYENCVLVSGASGLDVTPL
jgi:mannose-1-phosphate guanylyltransferase